MVKGYISVSVSFISLKGMNYEVFSLWQRDGC